MTEITPLYSQPLTKNHFHFPNYPRMCDLTCCFNGPNCTTGFFVWTVKWCTCLISCQQPISNTTILKTCAKMGQMHQHVWGIWWKKMILWWNKWPTLAVVMTSHWCSGAMKPYLSHICCRFQKQLQWFQNCEYTKNNTKFPLRSSPSFV